MRDRIVRHHGRLADNLHVDHATPHLARFLAAWEHHADGEPATVAALIDAASADIEVVDIHLPPKLGHQGIRILHENASTMFPGLLTKVTGLVIDGDRWATEWVMAGTHPASGRPFRCLGASHGTIDTEGRVSFQRDYWSWAQLESQVGRVEPPRRGGA